MKHWIREGLSRASIPYLRYALAARFAGGNGYGPPIGRKLQGGDLAIVSQRRCQSAGRWDIPQMHDAILGASSEDAPVRTKANYRNCCIVS